MSMRAGSVHHRIVSTPISLLVRSPSSAAFFVLCSALLDAPRLAICLGKPRFLKKADATNSQGNGFDPRLKMGTSIQPHQPVVD